MSIDLGRDCKALILIQGEICRGPSAKEACNGGALVLILQQYLIRYTPKRCLILLQKRPIATPRS